MRDKEQLADRLTPGRALNYVAQALAGEGSVEERLAQITTVCSHAMGASEVQADPSIALPQAFEMVFEAIDRDNKANRSTAALTSYRYLMGVADRNVLEMFPKEPRPGEEDDEYHDRVQKLSVDYR